MSRQDTRRAAAATGVLQGRHSPALPRLPPGSSGARKARRQQLWSADPVALAHPPTAIRLIPLRLGLRALLTWTRRRRRALRVRDALLVPVVPRQRALRQARQVKAR